MDGRKKCAEPASAVARGYQARTVNLDGTQVLGASDECEEVHDVVKDIAPRTRREEPIVCGDNCEARCSHTLCILESPV